MLVDVTVLPAALAPTADRREALSLLRGLGVAGVLLLDDSGVGAAALAERIKSWPDGERTRAELCSSACQQRTTSSDGQPATFAPCAPRGATRCAGSPLAFRRRTAFATTAAAAKTAGTALPNQRVLRIGSGRAVGGSHDPIPGGGSVRRRPRARRAGPSRALCTDRYRIRPIHRPVDADARWSGSRPHKGFVRPHPGMDLRDRPKQRSPPRALPPDHHGTAYVESMGEASGGARGFRASPPGGIRPHRNRPPRLRGAAGSDTDHDPFPPTSQISIQVSTGLTFSSTTTRCATAD